MKQICLKTIKNHPFHSGITFIEYQFPLVMHMTMHYRISQRQIIKDWYDEDLHIGRIYSISRLINLFFIKSIF